METIYTVLSTIGVGVIAYSFAGVIRLSRRVNDLELIRMEIVDLERKFEKEIQTNNHQIEELGENTNQTFIGRQSELDRRFDKVWSEHHKLTDLVTKLDITKSY